MAGQQVKLNSFLQLCEIQNVECLNINYYEDVRYIFQGTVIDNMIKVSVTCPQIETLTKFCAYKDTTHSVLNILYEETLLPLNKKNSAIFIRTKL